MSVINFKPWVSLLQLMHKLRKILSSQYPASKCERFFPISNTEWKKLFQISSQALVLPALYLKITSKGLNKYIDPKILSALKFFFEFNVMRNAGIREQIIDVTRELNKQGITPVWLKGATNLIADDWQSSGRMMVDLDFWIPDKNQHSATLQTLNLMGYQPVPLDLQKYPDVDNHNHFIPLQMIGKIAPLEVHKHPLSNHFQSLLSDQEILLQVEWIEWNGLKLGVLSKPHQMIQSLVQCLEEGPFFWLRVENSCLMKALDFHGRILALDVKERDIYLSLLSKKLKGIKKGHFFTMLKRDFGFDNSIGGNFFHLALAEWFYKFVYFPRTKFQRNNPKINYIFFMCKAAFLSLSSHGLVGVSSWPAKLRRHIHKIRTLN